MGAFKKILITVVAGLAAAMALFWLKGAKPARLAVPESSATNANSATASIVSPAGVVVAPPTNTAHKGFRLKASELTDSERAQFQADFKNKYKPAVARWAQAYAGHIPFDLDSLTPNSFSERVGRGSGDFVFVIDGITLGVRDLNGDTFVSYLHTPEAHKLRNLPSSGQPPVTTSPVSRDDLSRMLKLDSGKSFNDAEIRVIPSGISGALNGGAYVQVGGDPDDFLSWKYSMVFGPDGKLVLYLTGPGNPRKSP